MDVKVKINIVNERGEPFMGPGPLQLLEKIAVHKSINKAAKDMNLSYVKALCMLNRLEKNLGKQLVIRKRGGNERGGTKLTSYAKTYIENYRFFDKRVRKIVEKEFETFSNSWKRGEK